MDYDPSPQDVLHDMYVRASLRTEFSRLRVDPELIDEILYIPPQERKQFVDQIRKMSADDIKYLNAVFLHSIGK